MYNGFLNFIEPNTILYGKWLGFSKELSINQSITALVITLTKTLDTSRCLPSRL